MKILQIIYLLVFFIFISSCNDDECRVDTSVNLYATLSSKADSIWVKATDSDSILYNNIKSVQLATLPLKKFGELSEYIFIINSATDTIQIYHKNYDYLIDYNCGCVVYHTIDSIKYSTHKIKDIIILNSSVTNAGEENIKIYY